MLSSLLQAFGMSRPVEAPLGAQRSIDLSGNVFQFAMPENFSKDMPAPDLVESVNLEKLKPSDYGLLLERWWDIKEPNLFGKLLGTVMMTINVRSVSSNKQHYLHEEPYHFSRELDLVFSNSERLDDEYPDFSDNKFVAGSIATMLGDKLYSGYQSHLFNGQKWLRYELYRNGDGHLKLGNIIPITYEHYLDVTFYYAQNNGVLPREMRSEASKITDRILASMLIKYTPGNEIQQKVEKEWLDVSVEEMLEKHREVIIPKLFGPEALEKSKKPAELSPGFTDEN